MDIVSYADGIQKKLVRIKSDDVWRSSESQLNKFMRQLWSFQSINKQAAATI